MSSCQNKTKLSLENLEKNFGTTKVLKGININVKEGELVSIIGPSGCGKSTIFNLITDILKPDKGSIKKDGDISYMYQKDLLLPYKTIVENISLPLRIRGKRKKEANEAVLPYFEVFGLSGCEKQYPHELSGGMRQRVNFLRTYMCSNDIMLLDEPFGALDSITKRSLQNWFLDIRKKVNSTILLITHDIDEAIMLSDRIYVLSTRPAEILKEINLIKDINKNNIEDRAILKEKILKYL